MSVPELTQGYQFLNGQNDVNMAVMQGMGEALDDHAHRIDVLTATAVRIDKAVSDVTAQAVENDTNLRENLSKLEAIVTEQGAAILALGTDVQSAVRRLKS